MTDPQNPAGTEATAPTAAPPAAAPSAPHGNATLASEAPATDSLPDPRDPGLPVPMRTTELSCFFGKHKAVENVSLAFPE